MGTAGFLALAIHGPQFAEQALQPSVLPEQFFTNLATALDNQVRHLNVSEAAGQTALAESIQAKPATVRAGCAGSINARLWPT
jgi:hypothetical protein